MKRILTLSFIVLLFLSLFYPGLQAAKTPAAGKWQGMLNLPNGAKLRIVFNIRPEEQGKLSATMDSPDQGASGIPVSKIILKGTNLSLEVSSIGGNYQGTFTGDFTELTGTWRQAGQEFPLNLKLADKAEKKEVQANPATSKIIGMWLGKLSAGGAELRIVFNFSHDASGNLAATLDSPDQGAKGIPVTKTEFEGKSLHLEVGAVGGEFEGAFNDDFSELNGTWKQGGQSFPLMLKPTKKIGKVKRPQDPTPPFPYIAEEITFRNQAAGIILAGTLTLPRSNGPFPAAVLISGSGPQNRNEEIFNHRPFWVLADYLTREGLAVLRYDDRGVGQSGGSFKEATSLDFAGDVRSAVKFLKGRKEIDPRKIGLIGHSEGGLIAPMVAADSRDISFVVLLSAPGLTGEEILNLQRHKINEANGTDPKLVKLNDEFGKEIFRILKMQPNDSLALKEVVEYASKRWQTMDPEVKSELKKQGLSEQFFVNSAKPFVGPWMRFFVSYDPHPALTKVTCPLLAIGGEKDLQVPPAENLSRIESALKEGGNRNYSVKELPGLNHLFQNAQSGSPTEYGKIEETFSPTALKTISEWIQGVIK